MKRKSLAFAAAGVVALVAALGFATADQAPDTAGSQSAAGYAPVEADPVTFASTGAMTAMVMRKAGSEDRAYLVNIMSEPIMAMLGMKKAVSNRGLMVVFSSMRACTDEKTARKNSLKPTLKIEGRVVPVWMLCVDGGIGDSAEQFAILNAADDRFVRDAFTNQAQVLVDFDGFDVPFLTVGFAQAYKRLAGEA